MVQRLFLIGVAMIVTLVPLAPRAAAADTLNVMICYPGGPGSEEEAAPRLAAFFRLVEAEAGWPAERVQARYLTSAEACEAHLSDARPQVAILSLGAFLAQGEALKALPLLEVTPPGGGDERYHVVVEGDPATDLAGLEGKTLAGDLLGDPQFLTRVVFRMDKPAEEFFTLKATHTPLRAIKLVHRGKAAAVILDANTHGSLATLPFADKLRTVFSSEPLPGWPVAALGDKKPGDRLGKADRAALTKALKAVCSKPAGKAICDEVRLGGFEAVGATTYSDIRKLYDGGK